MPARKKTSSPSSTKALSAYGRLDAIWAIRHQRRAGAAGRPDRGTLAEILRINLMARSWRSNISMPHMIRQKSGAIVCTDLWRA